MVKLIDALITKLPSAADIDYDKLVFKAESYNVSANIERFREDGFIYKNKQLIIRASFVADDSRGVSLALTKSVVELQDVISNISGWPWHDHGVMDFNWGCPIYDPDGDISHLPTDALDHFIEEFNHIAVITPTVYCDRIPKAATEEQQETGDFVAEKQWKWQVYAVKLMHKNRD